jgi:hypothetical protein
MSKPAQRNRVYVQEQSRLAEKRADGTRRVILITEGIGSTGVYSADLIDASAYVFEDVPSYMDHPIDPEHPEKRSVLSIGGRFSNVVAEDGEFGRQLAADFKPRAEYEPLFDEFGDVLGLSIFCGAYGEKDATGRVVVEAFDDQDPYRSVDVVVAAGRGGRFKRAQESLRAIESSLGVPEGSQPGAASAQESNNTQEEEMKPEEVKAIVEEALAEALKPITTFFANEDARRQAEADAADKAPEVKDAVEAAIATVEAVKAAKLPEKIETKLIEAAKNGDDITEAFEFAKEVAAEAKTPASKKGDAPSSYVTYESAGGKRTGFGLGLGGKR